MTHFFLDIRLAASGYDDSDQLEEFIEYVLDELNELEGVIDPDATARLSTGAVIFTVGVEAEAEPQALRHALTTLRAAVHAAEGATPGWDAHIREVEQTVRAAEPDDELTTT